MNVRTGVPGNYINNPGVNRLPVSAALSYSFEPLIRVLFVVPHNENTDTSGHFPKQEKAGKSFQIDPPSITGRQREALRAVRSPLDE